MSEVELAAFESWAKLAGPDIGDAVRRLVGEVRLLKRTAERLRGVHFNCPHCGVVIKNDPGDG